MSEPLWPSHTFQVNLSLLQNEATGPITNSKNTAILPAQWGQDLINLPLTRVTWAPGITGADNRELKHGDIFTITGAKSEYLKNTYGIGYAPADRAFLTVIS